MHDHSEPVPGNQSIMGSNSCSETGGQILWTYLGQKFSSLLSTVTSSNGFYSPPPKKKKWFETGLLCKHCMYRGTSSLRILKIRPRNLNEIVCSWIRRRFWPEKPETEGCGFWATIAFGLSNSLHILLNDRTGDFMTDPWLYLGHSCRLGEHVGECSRFLRGGQEGEDTRNGKKQHFQEGEDTRNGQKQHFQEGEDTRNGKEQKKKIFNKFLRKKEKRTQF